MFPAALSSLDGDYACMLSEPVAPAAVGGYRGYGQGKNGLIIVIIRFSLCHDREERFFIFLKFIGDICF